MALYAPRSRTPFGRLRAIVFATCKNTHPGKITRDDEDAMAFLAQSIATTALEEGVIPSSRADHDDKDTEREWWAAVNRGRS